MEGYIDIYCERLAPGLWAEPINAITNLSFFIAALCVWKLSGSYQSIGGKILSLIILAIGTGSALFHTFATPLAQLSDVLPILIFQLAFLYLYTHDVLKFGRIEIAVSILMFFILSIVFESLPKDWMNGSLGYVPALLFLLGLGVFHFRRKMEEEKLLLLAGIVFFTSLILRTLDESMCSLIPVGTHFLWHILNGCVLYLVSRAYIKNAPPRL